MVPMIFTGEYFPCASSRMCYEDFFPRKTMINVITLAENPKMAMKWDVVQIVPVWSVVAVA